MALPEIKVGDPVMFTIHDRPEEFYGYAIRIGSRSDYSIGEWKTPGHFAVFRGNDVLLVKVELIVVEPRRKRGTP